MEEPFDPYHTWLGISGADQPLHHYRLLGIELFEEDAEVISNVADARMAHIKQFQTGKHSKESQQILNEIAAAKVCLLNPEKKADYDADLREQLEPGKPAVPLPPPLPPDVADHPSGEQQVSGPPPVAAPGTAVAAVSPSLAPPSQAPHSADQPSEEQQAPTPPPAPCFLIFGGHKAC